jgi:hypothetical protein
MVAVPAATPFSTPVVAPTLAMPEAELLHAPPVVVLLSDDDAPTHILVVPVIGLTIGAGSTVSITVTLQPDGGV